MKIISYYSCSKIVLSAVVLPTVTILLCYAIAVSLGHVIVRSQP